MRAFNWRAALISSAIIALGYPGAIFAHAFGESYILPVPLWLYAYGSAAALVLSFLVIGSLPQPAVLSRDISGRGIVRFFRSRFVVRLVRMIIVFLFLLPIVAGFIGVNSATLNINMTLFWIIFLLGVTYASAIFGNVWSALDPLRRIYRWYADVRISRITYPPALGMWPAVLSYVIIIWLELIGKTDPLSLSIALSIYAAYTFAAAAVFGEEAWFANAEFFSVFFGIIARIAPIAIEKRSVHLRLPFAGLIEKTARNASEVWFIIFMIASTSFDGFEGSLPMLRLYLRHFSFFASYDLFRTLALLVVPVLFFRLYALCLWLAKRAAQSALSLRTMALEFAYTLVPIALAYNIAHYYTLLLVQGQHVIHLISDPFGFGWNLFGTAHYAIAIGIMQAGFIWHSQVAVLLVGHIASVYLGHIRAVRLFTDKKRAFYAELPLLVLMMAFTVVGLWILSQPLAG
jgi:hypothetical protein